MGDGIANCELTAIDSSQEIDENAKKKFRKCVF